MTLLDLIADSIVEIVKSRLPWLFYSYPRTYVVAAVNSDKRLDLKPPAGPSGVGLEPLDDVEQWGLGIVTPAVGSTVGVMFRDAANMRQPIVVPWGFGSVPVKVAIDATTEIDLGTSPTRGAARLNDSVSAGIWSFVYTTPAAIPTLTVTYTPVTGAPTSFSIILAGAMVTLSGNPAAIATNGVITSASSKVKVE